MYFQVPVTVEQVNYANQLVDYSLKHHQISNIWDKNEEKRLKTRDYRFTGSLGEVLFADTYQLPRKTRAYGAIDGQDLGKDFQLSINQQTLNIDTKAMQRNSGILRGNYVLNIPASQLHKRNSLTDCYYCLSFHQQNQIWLASVVGYVAKPDILTDKVGVFYAKGTVRTRANNTIFTFNEDTYEIDFKDLLPPIITPYIKQLEGMKMMSYR